jgi:hypothetical protein
MMSMVRTTVLITLLTLAASTLAAAQGWEAELTVRAGRAENRLAFGQHPAASAGIDGVFDVPALLAGDLKASFVLAGGKYWRDIRALGAAGWQLRVESSLSDQELSIHWQPTALPAQALRLVDLTSGEVIDMRQQSDYRWRNEGARMFRIEMN